MVPPYVTTGGNGSLYDQFHTNVEGSGQLVENADVFDRLATEYNQHKFALKDALSAIKVTYAGQAAETMQGAFEPLIESVGQGKGNVRALPESRSPYYAHSHRKSS